MSAFPVLHLETPAGVEVVAPRGGSLDVVQSQAPWPPFRDQALAFVGEVSAAILRGEAHRRHAELIAFAYEMRAVKLKEIKARLQPATAGGVLRGRGLALHFAPANVDTIFLYSFMLSLLAGNTNIVRVSGKASEQVDLVLGTLNEVMARPEFADVAKRIVIVRYEHSDSITRELSSKVDVRVIWGGDRTVTTIREAPLPPLAREIVFPDRWSLAVFDATHFLASNRQRETVRNFANDAYWFAQMACSSPRLVAWRGDKATTDKASDAFFTMLGEEAQRHIDFIAPVDFVNKRNFEDEMAIRADVHIRAAQNNLVSVVRTEPRDVSRRTDFCGGGAFIDTRIDTLTDLKPLLDRRAQTIVSEGIDAAEWRKLLADVDLPGVDRIVPPGRALSFEFVWDGMDLLREFTRETSISI